MKKLLLILLLFAISLSSFAVQNYQSFKENFKDSSRMLLSAGMIPGADDNYKFGANFAVPADGLPHPVWNGNGSYPWPTTAQVLTVESSDINDDIAGSGAQAVRVFGLDENYLKIQEDVPLAGTSTSSTVQKFIRVNRAFVLVAGASGTAAGELTVKHLGNTVAVIAVPHNQTLQAVFTTAADEYVGIEDLHTTIFKVSGAASQVKEAIITAKFRAFGGVFQTKYVSGSRSDYGPAGFPFPAPLFLPPKTDVIVEVETNLTDTAVSAQFSYVTFDKAWIDQAHIDIGRSEIGF